jgi:hypothetical protein
LLDHDLRLLPSTLLKSLLFSFLLPGLFLLPNLVTRLLDLNLRPIYLRHLTLNLPSALLAFEFRSRLAAVPPASAAAVPSAVTISITMTIAVAVTVTVSVPVSVPVTSFLGKCPARKSHRDNQQDGRNDRKMPQMFTSHISPFFTESPISARLCEKKVQIRCHGRNKRI